MLKNKMILSGIGTIIIASAISTAVALNQPANTAGADTSPITTTLDKQQDELDNHEARITNTESNVNAIADKTGTNTTTVIQVPAPNTSVATTVAAPDPIVVTKFQQIPLDEIGNADCVLTYSDGTSYQWSWQIISPHGSWQTDGSGNNGKWVQTTQNNGSCDNTVLGKTK